MAKSKLFYELSEEADRDIEAIFDYTEETFGVDQAVEYLRGFEAVFARLLDNPKLGRERSEIRPHLSSILQGSHVVFYRILSDRLRIVRILHASRDLQGFIDPT